MSEKKSVDKKPIRDLLREKDAFLTTSEKAYEYLLRHTKAFITAAVTVAVVIVGVAIYVKYQAGAEEEATQAYEKAMELAVGQGGEMEAGIKALEQVRTERAGRKAARLAAMALVSLYGGHGQPEKALPLAENLLQTLPPAEISLKPLLLNALGGLYEASGDYVKAGKSYEAILGLGLLEPNLKQDTLLALGRVNTAAGGKDEAVKNYEALIREFPQSFKAFWANSKLAELKEAPVAFPAGFAPMSSAAVTAPAATGVEQRPAPATGSSGSPDAAAAPESASDAAAGTPETAGEARSE